MKKPMFFLAIAIPLACITSNEVIVREEINKTSAYSLEIGNTNGYLGDNDITRKIELSLDLDKYIDSNEIDVYTRNGIVLLSGKTRSYSERDRAIKLALNSRGVKAVKDNLKTENANLIA